MHVNLQLTPRSRVFLDKLTVLQLFKKFIVFSRTQRFITVFATTCHLFLTWARSIHSMAYHPASLRTILILSSYLCICLLSSFLPLGFSTKAVYNCSFPIHGTHSLIWCPHISWAVQIMKLIITFSPLSHYFHLFLNHFQPSLKVTDQGTHQYETAGITTVLDTDRKCEDKTFWTTRYQAFANLNLLLISSWMQLRNIRVIP